MRDLAASMKLGVPMGGDAGVGQPSINTESIALSTDVSPKRTVLMTRSTLVLCSTNTYSPSPWYSSNNTANNMATRCATPELKNAEHTEFSKHGESIKENGAAGIIVDEFGAHAKVDPAEIALVKKLDLWMMVCLSLVGVPFPWRRDAFQGTLQVNKNISELTHCLLAASPMGYVLPQLPRP